MKFAESDIAKRQKEQEEKEEAEVEDENKRVRKIKRALKKSEIDSDDIKNFSEEDFQNFTSGKKSNKLNSLSTPTKKISKNVPEMNVPMEKKSGRTVLRAKPIRYKKVERENDIIEEFDESIKGKQKDEKIDRKAAQAVMFTRLREGKDKTEE